MTALRLRRRRRQGVLLAMLLVVAGRAAEATDFDRVHLTCPLDGTRFNTLVVGSTSSFGASSDFRPEGGVDWVESSLASCPSCGFTARHDRFSKPGGLDVEKARRALSGIQNVGFCRDIATASAIERIWTRDLDTLAHLALIAKWRADDTGEPALVRMKTLEAIAAHEQAWAAKEAGARNAPPKPATSRATRPRKEDADEDQEEEEQATRGLPAPP